MARGITKKIAIGAFSYSKGTGSGQLVMERTDKGGVRVLLDGKTLETYSPEEWVDLIGAMCYKIHIPIRKSMRFHNGP